MAHKTVPERQVGHHSAAASLAVRGVVQIGACLRSFVSPVQKGTQALQSEATNFSDARFQFDFLCGSHCFVVSIIQSLPLRTSERFKHRRRMTPTRSEVAGRVVSIGMGAARQRLTHRVGSRCGT